MKALVVILACSIAVVCNGAEHPRLLFTDAKIANLKNPEGRSKVVTQAEHGGIEALSLAYRVTGEKQYADKVREIVLAECKKPWGDGLGAAHKCLNIALGYDSIYDALSPEDRKSIEQDLVSRGIEPMLNDWLLGEKRVHALDTMGHNWWSACVFLPGVAAMAVMDVEPRAKDWLDRIQRGSVEWFNYPGNLLENKPANFDSAGAFYESVGYMSYGLSQYLTFRLAWENAFGKPLPAVPILDKVGDFFLNTCYPNSGEIMALNFGDSSLHAVASQPLVLLWANGIRKPRYLWYLAQTKDTGSKETITRNSPMGLVYFPSDAELAKAPATPDLPVSSIYKDMGWAMMRSSWAPNATMLGVKSGITWNHAHADAGSFILFHHGENLLIDSGNCWYANPQYDEYYRQSRAHNVVLFNGEGENPEDTYYGSKFPGSLQYLIDAGDLKYVLADATGPVAQNFSRCYRQFLWLGDVILIIDDIKTHKYGQFEWLLHVGGDAKRKGLDLNVQNGDARVAVRPLFPETFPEGFPHDAPEKVKLVEKTGLKDHQQDTTVTYYAVVPPGQARVMKFITAILLNPEKPPKLERLETKDAIGVRVQQEGKSTDVYLNLLADGRLRHRNANLTVDGWQTDAYLFAITSSGGTPSRFFVANGSYFRRDGTVVLDSLSKVFAIAENGKTTMYP